ncbi:cobalamin biosynthesis protein CobD/CbiB [Thalassotalea fusca]
MEHLPSLSSYQPVIVLVVAIIAKYCYQITVPSRSSFFTFYCHQLANKVNPPSNSHQQQKIAGFMALIITLVPIILILWLFESFVDVEFIWHFILMFVAIGNVRLSHYTRLVAKQVTQNANYQAKETLAPFVLRQTSQLSSLGLTKATLEMTILTRLQQVYSVVFWYLVAGPLVALGYRLILEMHYSWNRKHSSYTQFGLWAETLVNLLVWLPARISYLLYFVTHLSTHSLLYWQLTRRDFFSLGNNVNLSLFALLHNVKLGGVAMYEQTKLRRRAFNEQGQQPTPQDLIKIDHQLNWHSSLLAIMALTMVIVTGLVT